MFGYIVINKPDLKFKEFDIYQGFYCGLCHSLRKRHGLSGQLTLTYDMTFLAMLLTSLYEPELTQEFKRCLVHPAKKHLIISSRYTDYVADMNVILAYHKAMDDWNDNHNIIKLAFAKIIENKDCNYKEKASAIESLLKELGTREKENETNIDVMAGIFGKIMAVIFVPKQEDIWSASLSKIGFFLGKFIYILDAYDDLEQDIKKGCYNPFKTICQKDDFDDKIKTMLTMMMAECSKEFECLPILENASILRNIIYAGVWNSFYRSKEKRSKNE